MFLDKYAVIFNAVGNFQFLQLCPAPGTHHQGEIPPSRLLQGQGLPPWLLTGGSLRPRGPQASADELCFPDHHHRLHGVSTVEGQIFPQTTLS